MISIVFFSCTIEVNGYQPVCLPTFFRTASFVLNGSNSNRFEFQNKFKQVWNDNLFFISIYLDPCLNCQSQIVSAQLFVIFCSLSLPSHKTAEIIQQMCRSPGQAPADMNNQLSNPHRRNHIYESAAERLCLGNSPSVVFREVFGARSFKLD